MQNKSRRGKKADRAKYARLILEERMSRNNRGKESMNLRVNSYHNKKNVRRGREE